LQGRTQETLPLEFKRNSIKFYKSIPHTMKKIYILLLAVMFLPATEIKAQTTAMNNNFIDCAGNPQSIYADLDAGKAVILEFFMNSCSPCITAGSKLESMKADLLAEFPGMIKAYAFAYNNTYTCTTINNWVNTNGFTSIPADSGAAQVAYYGGMGMPTIVILGGGTSHTVLGSPYIGFTTSDTATMANDIRDFLSTTGIKDQSDAISHVNVFPNPAASVTNLTFNLKNSTGVTVDVVDVTGRIVMNVSKKNVASGVYNETINTSGLADGLYYISIKAAGIITHKPLNVTHK
jgi:hypothetical protein